MSDVSLVELVGPELASAFEAKGYSALTPVQLAVLDPSVSGRDLRISSQTGSGKTVALGLVIRDAIAAHEKGGTRGIAKPAALVVTPTRELARQVTEELGWLFPRTGVACVTGGADFRAEGRALAAFPAVVVGTPGRLLDYLKRGGVDGRGVLAVVLDEADRMLDLGFRDDLMEILGHAPEEHSTHLVSATFPREVKALADKVQKDPKHVAGTPLGKANVDIDHVIVPVRPEQRVDALVNLLLASPDETALVFARTRADVGCIAEELRAAGFTVDSLSGEMEQRERNRALSRLKQGELDALVATDVAARGIDASIVTRVIHVEAPSDADAYTHRSGRTGRAGRKGRSLVLTPPSAISRTSALLHRAGVRFRTESLPTPEEVSKSLEERLYADLTRATELDDGDDEPSTRFKDLAVRLVESGHAAAALARLLDKTTSGPVARNVRSPEVRAPEPRGFERGPRNYEREGRGPRPDRFGDRDAGPSRFRDGPPRPPREGASFPDGPARERAPREGASFRDGPARERAPRENAAFGDGPPRDRAPREPRNENENWVSFRVSWGKLHGADARRLVPMLCRRGGIEGRDIGAIRVTPNYSVVDVAERVATTFAEAVRAPDPRNPRVQIRIADGDKVEGREPPTPRRPHERSPLPRHEPPRPARKR